MSGGLRSLVATATLCAFFATLAHGGMARAQEDPGLEQARNHFQMGKAAYDAGDFATAVKEFKAAQALRPSPKLDYNIGKAYEHLGPVRARAALKYYNKYLAETDPESPDAEMRKTRDEVRGRIPILQQQAQAEAEREAQAPQDPNATPQQDVQPDQPDQPVVVEEVPPQQKKHRSRWWVAPLIIGGIVVTIVIIVALEGNVSVNNGSTGALTTGGAGNQGPVLFRF